jgi:polyphosphate glucokinase
LVNVHILGIDIGGSGVKGAVVDASNGEMLTPRRRFDTPKPATPKAVGASVAALAEGFDWKGPIGCAFPARIKQGVVQSASNIDNSFIGVNFAKKLGKKTGLPVTLLNDADAAGLAEMRYGAGRGRKGVVLILTVGTGIGSAIFLDGRLVPNTEFGHVIVSGKVGEHYAADSARKRAQLDWKKWAKRFQRYLDRIEFLIGPDLIVLGGGVSRPSKSAEFLPYLTSKAELVTAALQNEAGIIGAAVAAEEYLADT